MTDASDVERLRDVLAMNEGLTLREAAFYDALRWVLEHGRPSDCKACRAGWPKGHTADCKTWQEYRDAVGVSD